MKISNKGIELIKFFESLHDGNLSKIGLQPKLCPSDIWTIGWGHAIVDPLTNKFITASTPNGYERACELYPDLTLEQAEDLLKKDIAEREVLVNKNLKIKLNQSQFDALLSHTFNCGVSETLYNLINNYPLDSTTIKLWWEGRYIKSKGVKLKGLVKRRRVEYELFSTGELNLK